MSEPLRPGHYWKTPFLWEPGCPEPQPPAGLMFEPLAHDRLVALVARVMGQSQDPSDQHAVAAHGERGAAEDLLSFAPEYFTWEPDWWSAAKTPQGDAVGFVLPVLFKAEERSRDGRPQGTIFYIGVMPEHRGKGFAKALLARATRIFIAANCWRIFCDTSSDNQPMLRTFRSAGYMERKPWQRPVA